MISYIKLLFKYKMKVNSQQSIEFCFILLFSIFLKTVFPVPAVFPLKIKRQINKSRECSIKMFDVEH